MTLTTDIHTDLLTPLGAYLRLREGAAASFLLESVEKGRLGQASLVGSGARLVTFAEAEQAVAAGSPVVGYLGYDHVAVLEPTVPLPETGGDLPESLFVIADTLVRFDHAKATAEVLAGDRDAIAEVLARPVEDPRPTPAPRGETSRFPSREEYEASVVEAKRLIAEGDAFQIVLSQRAERATSVTPVGLYRALRRVNPSPYLFLLELGPDLALVGSSPETLVKLEGRRASLNP